MEGIIAAIEAAQQQQRERELAMMHPTAASAVPAAASAAPAAPPATVSAAAPDATPAPATAAAPAAPQAAPARRKRAYADVPLQGMFADGNTLLRAVIAGEVLGKPAALRENTHWSLQPNEPST